MVKAARIVGTLARNTLKIGKQGSKVPSGISTLKTKPVKEEVITRAAIVVKLRDSGDEFIFYGTNHGEAYALAEDAFNVSRGFRNPFSAGFALFETSAGRIVDRDEAKAIAKASNRLTGDADVGGAISEDIKGVGAPIKGGGGDTDLHAGGDSWHSVSRGRRD